MKIKQFLATSLLLATVSTSVLATTHSFEDIADHWGLSFIEDAVSRGFFAGRSETEFDPEAYITRAEFAIVMLKVAGIEAPDTETEGPWYTKYYEAASSNFFLPNTFTLENLGENITREEMAATMILTVGPHFFSHLNSPLDFSDLEDIDEDYQDFVQSAVNAGLMAGMDGGFNPQGTATRAMAATVSTTLADSYFNDDPLEEPNKFDSKLHEAYAAIIHNAREEEENMAIPTTSSVTDPMWPFLQGNFQIEAEHMEAFSFAVSTMNIKAYGVAIIKPTEGSHDAVMEGIKYFQENKIEQFTLYLPDQLVYAQNPTIEVLDDGTIVLVMGESAEVTAPKILEALKNFDLDTFEFPEVDQGVGDMLPGVGGMLPDMHPDTGDTHPDIGGMLPDMGMDGDLTPEDSSAEDTDSDDGTSAEDTDSDTEDSNSDTEDTDSDTEDTDSDTEDTDSDTEDTDSDTEDSDSDTEDSNSDTEDSDSDTEDSDSDTEDKE